MTNGSRLEGSTWKRGPEANTIGDGHLPHAHNLLGRSPIFEMIWTHLFGRPLTQVRQPAVRRPQQIPRVGVRVVEPRVEQLGEGAVDADLHHAQVLGSHTALRQPLPLHPLHDQHTAPKFWGLEAYKVSGIVIDALVSACAYLVSRLPPHLLHDKPLRIGNEPEDLL